MPDDSDPIITMDFAMTILLAIAVSALILWAVDVLTCLP